MATTTLEKRKVRAGNYLFQDEDGNRYRVAKNDDGAWVASELEEGDEGTELVIDTYDTLTAAEEALENGATAPETPEETAEAEADGDGPAPGTQMSKEPAEEVAHPEGTVAWSIKSNPNSKLHKVGDDQSTKTGCGLPIPQDGRSMNAPATRGKCGVCFR